MKRIFIAVKVDPGDALLKMISSFKAVLDGENIRWTNPDNIHITIVFLGDTENNQISILNNILKDKCEGSGKFELIIKGSGVFKNMSGRVIWAGIEQSEKFSHLFSLIKSCLKTAGVKTEERPFKPHLTLGQIKHPEKLINIKELTEKYSGTEIQKIPVNEVILFESILLNTGPVYKQIGKYTL